MTGAVHFTDDKAPDALRTIGEVSDALGIKQHVLRYWEEQFPMLRPLKRSGGRRYYRPDDIALLQRIDGLVHRQGYTLRGARLALTAKGPGEGATTIAADPATPSPETPSPTPSTSGSGLASETTFGMRARLVAVRHRLATALQDA